MFQTQIDIICVFFRSLVARNCLQFRVFIFVSLLSVIGHETKVASSEGTGSRSHRTKDCLTQSASRLQCRLSAETMASDKKSSAEGCRLSRNSSMKAASNIQQTSAVIEGVPKSSPILRPALSSPVRKGHGHRHRRAVRCNSTTVGGGDDGSGDHLTPSPTDVHHSEFQRIIDSECNRVRRSAVRSYFRPSLAARDDEKIALETFSTAGVVGSPVHSDLSSLSSYKETSPESETFPPSAISRLLELSGNDRVRRRPVDAVKAAALSHSRDSLETYTCRKSTGVTSFTSDKVIVHRDASSSIELDDIGLTELSPKAQSSFNDEIVSHKLDSNADLKVESHCILLSKCLVNKASPKSIEAMAAALTTTVDMEHSSATGSSQSETKSESSRTLTAGSGNLRTVNDGVKQTVARKSRHGRAKSIIPSDTASKLISCNRSLLSNTGSTTLMSTDWLGASSDSDDSHSSGMF